VDIVGILAHQGGWDEILLISGPMVVIAGLLILAKRRVDASVKSSDSATSTPPADTER
jgi:hypothetical protein